MSVITPNIPDTKPPRQTVTFSEFSELVYYHIPCDYDKSTTWYSSSDRCGFRQTLIENARHVSQEINDLQHGDILTHEQQSKCIGIEIFLSNGVARCAQQAKRAHIAAVLSEQRIQNQNGTVDIARLSMVSQIRSRANVENARDLAAGYAALLME